MITSTRNPTVKMIRRLLSSRRFRQSESAFVVEGDRWFNELLNHGIQPMELLVTHRWLESGDNQQRIRHLGVHWKLVDDKVMDSVSDTETAPGILAVVPSVRPTLPERLTFTLILDRVADPGNMGAMIRSASAAGVDAVLLAPGCVDHTNPKVVRASMGALLHCPVIPLDWPGIAKAVGHMKVWLAFTEGQIAYTDVDWRKPSALIIGSEATGAGPVAHQMADGISIPMSASAESLNAAVAAGIILFEAVRQRSLDPS